MNKRVFGVLSMVLVICLFAVFATGCGGSETANGGAEVAEGNETPEGKGTLGDYEVEIKSYRLAKDYEDKDVVIVTYGFTNNADDSASFSVAVNETVFQGGVELETTFFLDDSAEFESDNYMKNIKKGATLDVEMAYVLNDTTSDIEVEVEEFMSITDEKVEKTFSIAQ